jgi:hypothetical protein
MDKQALVGHILSRSEFVTESGCRIWMGPVTKGRGWGYGMASKTYNHLFGTRYVHRIVYLHERGPLPEGTEVDHICNVRSCVNVDHLRPLTHRENIRRAVKSVVAQNMAKTHCKSGHPLFGDNLKMQYNHVGAKTLSRRCKRCHADVEARRRERLISEGYINVNGYFVLSKVS